jgi:hypothetical protein
MGELQPIQYLYMFNNILNWTTTILITIFVRKNLQEIDSKKYGVNHNLALLNLIPYLNIVTLPYLLKTFESKSTIEGNKIEFGFKYSLVNLFLLTIATLMVYLLSYLMQKSVQEMIENAGKTTTSNLDLASTLVSNPIYGSIMCFITIAYSGICILIYKEQRNSIKLTQQQLS